MSVAGKTTEELLDTAMGEVASLGRVSHRLAMTDDGEPLEKVLSLLLPRLLGRVGSNHKRTADLAQSNLTPDSPEAELKKTYDQIHTKLVQMLSHTMKRTRADSMCRIPCEAILAMLYDGETMTAHSPADVDPFTLNLSLAFLTLGLPRCDTEEVECLLPGLLVLVGAHSGIDSLLSVARKSQAQQCAHLALRAIEAVVAWNGASGASELSPRLPPSASLAGNKSVVSTPEADHANIEAIRRICGDDAVGPAVYNLLLDALLYQPMPGGASGGSSLPPSGLSVSSFERLIAGTSTTAKNWAAEHAPHSRLREMKLCLLDFIAPCRRWAAFQGKTDCDDGEEDRLDLGTARTVALLVVSSGDPHPDVSARSSSFLKAHMDSMRNVSRDQSTRRHLQSKPPVYQRSAAFCSLGNPHLLTCALLSLVLGDNVALSIVGDKCDMITSLGVIASPLERNAPLKEMQTVLLSTKRRMVSDEASARILLFLSKRVFDDIPRIFTLPSEKNLADAVLAIGRLVLASCDHILCGPSGSIGSKGGPHVAASSLLNSFCVRLAFSYDRTVESDGATNKAAAYVHDLLARALAIACAMLSSQQNIRSGTKGTIEVKDACYGVICSLARSKFAASRRGSIFNCGGTSTPPEAEVAATGGTRSIATAALLFGCASNEEETLRPRSVAALDALLAAYCRVHKHAETEHQQEEKPESEGTAVPNPWQQIGVQDARSEPTPPEEIQGHSSLESLSKSLLSLLWSAAQPSQPKASRLAASRWASQLIKPLDLASACHLLCFLAGDSDVTTASLSREGLGISSDDIDEEDLMRLSAASKNEVSYPGFQSMVRLLFTNSKGAPLRRPAYSDFSPSGKCAALRFGMFCLLSDVYGDDDPIKAFMTTVSSELCRQGGGANRGQESARLQDECSLCLRASIANSHFARELVASGSLPLNCVFMGQLALSASSSTARRHLAASCGHLYEDFSLWCLEGQVQLKRWAEDSGVSESLSVCGKKLDEMQTNLHMLGEVHGAAFLGASCVRAFRLVSMHPSVESSDGCDANAGYWKSASSILSALGRGTSHSDDSIGNACARGLTIALSYGCSDAPILQEMLYPAMATVLTELKASVRRYSHGDHMDATRVTLLAQATGIALAASTAGAGHRCNAVTDGNVGVGQARLRCVDSLFALLGSAANRKDPEISIVAGEALALYADAFSPNGASWTIPAKLRPDSFDESYAVELPPHKHVIYVVLEKEIKATIPQKRTACAPALLALVGRAARMVNKGKANTKRAFVQEVASNLIQFQSAFISLLGDPKSKQLSRESCCLGLAACRGLTAARLPSGESLCMAVDLNERLLRAFGQTTNFGGSAMMETRRQNTERLRQENRDGGTADSFASIMEEFGEPEVGGAAGLGEAALGAYREMASAAMSLDRPDVLYSLMLLSVTHPVWHSSGMRERYNAPSLLGDFAGGMNADEIRRALRPHLRNLIPQLLRACNDPNKQTRDQMISLWTSLAGSGAESRSIVAEHLLPTIDVLTSDATNKLWRARAGACGALSEIIVGRSWRELGGGEAVINDDDLLNDAESGSSAGIRLLRLWRVTTRALDDVRLTVRESGQGLARSVRSLAIRLCDPCAVEMTDENTSVRSVPSKDAEIEAAAAANTALRWLVKFGLDQPCAEAVGFCVSSLLGIVDVARPSTLQPVLPELIGSLSMAMSGLEPAALNYLQVRAAGQDDALTSTEVVRYDQLERLRLQLAQSGPIAGALTKCLDMLRFLDVEAQREVIPQLDSALRCGAGFATRAAAADAVSTLCSTCPLAFKFPGHSNTNPTVRLLRALYYASERERGSAAKEKMAHALGSLAAIAPGQSVRALVVRACDKYKCATGSNDDPTTRRAAAAALRAVAVRASGQFSDGGSNDVWFRKVLPLAFLGRKESDKKLASLWKDVWEEGGSAAIIGGAHTEDSGVLLEEKLLPQLVNECVSALKDVSWARRVTACAALIELSEMDLLAPAPRVVDHHRSLEQNYDSLLRSRRRAQSSNEALKNCVKLIVKSRVWNGKAEVVRAAVKVAEKWIDTDNTCLGWERDDCDSFEKRCPWIPIIQDISWEDLFSGDSWFITTESESIEDDSDPIESTCSQKVADENNEVEDSAYEFRDVDLVLGEDVVPENKMDPGVQALGPVTVSGLCRALLEQALPSVSKMSTWSRDYVLPFRSSALQGLAELLRYSGASSASNEYIKFTYRMIAPQLLRFIEVSSTDAEKSAPPLVIAQSVNCLAAGMWHGLGEESDRAETEDVLKLAKTFYDLCGTKQPAWTVREASAEAGASLVLNAALCPLKKHETASTLLDIVTQTMKDRKFWRVRCAGLKLLRALVSRVQARAEHLSVPIGAHPVDADHQLLLEALLPHKERILKLAKSGLSDNESKVTAVATEICSAVAWWP